MDLLIKFLAQHPHIHYATPASPDFESLRPGYVINDTMPAMIVRPRSATDVAGLVGVLKTNDLPFSVRVGGHDMFGRYQVNDAIIIDLREIAYIHVDRDSHTARIGGGVLIADLIKELDQHGMVVPHPVISSVGFVGWATHGGYGLLNAEYGMGADQILQAKLVDANALVCDADEDMLTAIRGGGGALGVIVELTIKVYPLAQMLAGFIIYDSNDLSTAIKRYSHAYRRQSEEGLPKELSTFQSVINSPDGKVFAVLFVWASSNLDEGQKWLSKLTSWSPVAMSTVSSTTMSVFSESTKGIVPPSVYGKSLTISIRDLTPEVVDVLSRHALLQPNSRATMIGIHELRACTPQPLVNTVIDNRAPHFVIELLSTVQDAELLDAALVWAHGLYDALMRTDPANILASTYLPLTGPDKVDMKGIYGKKFDILKRIKLQYDPENVFKLALVQL